MPGKIICEFTANGNECPDKNCILDHTKIIKIPGAPKKRSVQTRFGRPVQETNVGTLYRHYPSIKPGLNLDNPGRPRKGRYA